MLPDGNCLGREYLAKDPLDLGAHAGDAGHHDGDARCVACAAAVASSCCTQRAQVTISSRLSTASTSTVVSAAETSLASTISTSWPRSRKASISCCCAGVMRSKPVSTSRRLPPPGPRSRLPATQAATCPGLATPLCGRCAQSRAPTRESSRHPDRPAVHRGGS